MITRLHGALIGAAVVALSAFDVRAQEAAPSDLPDWVMRGSGAFRTPGGRRAIYGVGTESNASNPAQRRRAADAQARAEVSKVLEVCLGSLGKAYAESGASSGEQRLAADVLKKLVQRGLSGADVVDRWIGHYGSDEYSLVQFDFESFRNELARSTDLKDGARRALLPLADRTFADLSGEDPPPAPADPAPEPAKAEPPARARDLGVVAVLPMNATSAGIDEPTKLALEEAIRSAVGDALADHGYTLLTGDTTLAYLADNGLSAEKVCDSTCALAAAKELKARLFVSGTVAKSEGAFVGFVRMYDTLTGRQLASIGIEGDSIRALRKSFEGKAPEFVEKALKRLP